LISPDFSFNYSSKILQGIDDFGLRYSAINADSDSKNVQNVAGNCFCWYKSCFLNSSLIQIPNPNKLTILVCVIRRSMQIRTQKRFKMLQGIAFVGTNLFLKFIFDSRWYISWVFGELVLLLSKWDSSWFVYV
jgi:hypothetical protein